MFRMRSEHINEFRRELEADFITRAIAYLRKNLFEQCGTFTDEKLAVRVRAGIESAAPYRLTTEFGVMSFVLATFLIGPRFDVTPEISPAAEVLRNDELSPEDRAEALLAVAWEHYRKTNPKLG